MWFFSPFEEHFNPNSCNLHAKGATKVGLKSVFVDSRKNGWRYTLALKTWFLTLLISYINPELELCSCKIDLLMGSQSLNVKWPSWAEFFEHTLEILEINATLWDLQVIFLSFFDISNHFIFWNWGWMLDPLVLDVGPFKWQLSQGRERAY